MFEHLFFVLYRNRTMSALRLKVHANSFATFRRSLSDSKRDGCTVTAKVFTWSHSEPRSQALLRLSHYCGTRVHGKGSHCAPLFSPRDPRPARALKAGPPMEAGLFCVLATH